MNTESSRTVTEWSFFGRNWPHFQWANSCLPAEIYQLKTRPHKCSNRESCENWRALSGRVLQATGHLCPGRGCPGLCSQQHPLLGKDDTAECQLAKETRAEALRQVPRLISGTAFCIPELQKQVINLCKRCSTSTQVACAPWALPDLRLLGTNVFPLLLVTVVPQCRG